METIGDRIKRVRKDNHLTQEVFGERIGIKGNTVTGYERGIRNPSNSIINSICTIFQVDQTWLRTGEGDCIYIEGDPFQNDPLTHLFSKYNCNKLEQQLLISYFELTEKERYAFVRTLKKLFPKLSSIMEGEPDDPFWNEVESNENKELTIDEKVAEFRRQLELEEETGKKSSASGMS